MGCIDDHRCGWTEKEQTEEGGDAPAELVSAKTCLTATECETTGLVETIKWTIKCNAMQKIATIAAATLALSYAF